MSNIWIFNHYATKPDEPAARDYDMAKQLAERGNKITIFASAFSHYKLKIKYLEAKENWRIEDVNGVRFVWIRTFPYKKNNWRRFLNMLSYSWRVINVAVELDERPDVIIGTCVHPFAVWSAYSIAKKKKAKFFYMVRDLWPQTLVDIGYINKINPLVFFLRILEKFLYKKASKIITVLPYASDYISGLGIEKEKIVWIPNGVNLDLYKDIKEYKGGNKDNFVFMYTGIFARYANLDTIVKAAKILQDQEKNNIRFILIGDGIEKNNLLELSERLNLKNIEFRAMVPRSEVIKIMDEADAFISIIKDMPVLKYGIASNKLNNYLIFQRPVICAINAKNNPVEEIGAGIVIPPGNPEALAKACERMVSLAPMQRIEMGRKGADYVRKNYDIKILAEKLEKLLC